MEAAILVVSQAWQASPALARLAFHQGQPEVAGLALRQASQTSLASVLWALLQAHQVASQGVALPAHQEVGAAAGRNAQRPLCQNHP